MRFHRSMGMLLLLWSPSPVPSCGASAILSTSDSESPSLDCDGAQALTCAVVPAPAAALSDFDSASDTLSVAGDGTFIDDGADGGDVGDAGIGEDAEPGLTTTGRLLSRVSSRTEHPATTEAPPTDVLAIAGVSSPPSLASRESLPPRDGAVTGLPTKALEVGKYCEQCDEKRVHLFNGEHWAGIIRIIICCSFAGNVLSFACFVVFYAFASGRHWRSVVVVTDLRILTGWPQLTLFHQHHLCLTNLRQFPRPYIRDQKQRKCGFCNKKSRAFTQTCTSSSDSSVVMYLSAPTRASGFRTAGCQSMVGLKHSALSLGFEFAFTTTAWLHARPTCFLRLTGSGEVLAVDSAFS